MKTHYCNYYRVMQSIHRWAKARPHLQVQRQERRLPHPAEGVSERGRRQLLQMRPLGACQAADASAARGAQVELLRCQRRRHLAQCHRLNMGCFALMRQVLVEAAWGRIQSR